MALRYAISKRGRETITHLLVSSDGAEESETAAATVLLDARLLDRLWIRPRRLRIRLRVRFLQVSKPPSCRCGGCGAAIRSAGFGPPRGSEESRRRGFEAEGRAGGLGAAASSAAPAGFGGADVRAPPCGRWRGTGAEACGEGG